jgi:hypothetical protein
MGLGDVHPLDFSPIIAASQQWGEVADQRNAHAVQMQKLQAEQGQQAKTASIMKGATEQAAKFGLPTPTSYVEVLDNMVTLSGKVGDVSTMDQAAKSAGEWRKNEAETVFKQAEAAHQQADALKVRLDVAGHLLAGANSQETLDAANSAYTQLTNMPSPLAGQHFDPKKKEGWLRDLQDAHQQLDEKRLQANTASEIAHRTFEDKMAAARNKREEALAPLVRQREEQLSKVGGKPLVQASQARVMEIARTLPKDMAPEDREMAGRRIAAMADQFMRENPNRDPNEAEITARSKIDMQTGQDLRAGKSREMPLPPPTKDRPAKQGDWHSSSKGVARYLGNDAWSTK